jgi:phosphatidylglycerol---prolipoprotein diacylglyceryl transferase
VYPILVHFGNLVIHTYGVFIALAFLTAVILASAKAHLFKFNRDLILDLSFWILVSALIGARALEVIANLSYYRTDWLKVIKVWEGGMSYFGGLAGGVTGGVIYCKRTGLAVWSIGDLLAPYIALGQAIGRIGCLSAGCCYGKVCENWWAIKFSDPNSLAPTGINLYPTQIYESVGDFVIFLILLNVTKRRKFSGQALLLYFVLYSSLRFIIEFYRGDNPDIWYGFTLYQLISVGILVTALVIYILRWKKQLDMQKK